MSLTTLSAVNEGHCAAFIQTLHLHEFALKWKLKYYIMIKLPAVSQSRQSVTSPG